MRAKSCGSPRSSPGFDFTRRMYSASVRCATVGERHVSAPASGYKFFFRHSHANEILAFRYAFDAVAAEFTQLFLKRALQMVEEIHAFLRIRVAIAIEHRLQELLFAAEMAKKRGFIDPGAFGDFPRGGAARALLREKLARGGENARSRLLNPGLASRPLDKHDPSFSCKCVLARV